MKIEHVNGWKMAGKMAAIVALGAGASAQFAGRGEQVMEGRPVIEVSMDNDIRPQPTSGGKIILHRNNPRQLELTFKMRPRVSADPLAVIPPVAEMESSLVLENGEPSGMAVIDLDTRAPELHRAGGGVRITGFFDADGLFAVALPSDVDVRGLFAYAEDGRLIAHLGARELVKKTGGAMAAGSERPVVDALDLEQEVQLAYGQWMTYWTELQLKSGGKFRARELDGSSAVVSPAAGSRAGGKIILTRPRTPATGHGHALPGTSVDSDTDSGSGPVAGVDLADPQGGQRAGGKIHLRRPAHRDDHVLQKR